MDGNLKAPTKGVIIEQEEGEETYEVEEEE